MIKSRNIYVTFQKEGIHCYPAAATDPLLEDVSFLASPHRHIFHFRVELEVSHNDRDVEFIQLKRWCENLYGHSGALQLNYKSCEMLAEELISLLVMCYRDRKVKVEVSEDNENGAILTNYE